jgi:regulator of protease activity HflC (stomatin/prohibitin superfamily)
MNSQDSNTQITINPVFLFIVVGVIFLLILASRAYIIVEPGNAAIIKRMGKIIGDPKAEGLAVLIPFVDKAVIMDIRTQKLKLKAKAESKDLQSVEFEIALNYHALRSDIGVIYQKIGIDYEAKVIIPNLHEAFKNVTAKYNAEELITKRSAVSEQVKGLMVSFLIEKGFQLEALSIEDFNFSNNFTEAIERKQVAEQDALKAKHKLNEVATQKQQLVETARAEAESLTIKATAQAEAIRIKAEAEAKALELLAKAAKPSALQARTIEKWDGVLPSVTGGAMPFIDVNKYAESTK